MSESFTVPGGSKLNYPFWQAFKTRKQADKEIYLALKLAATDIKREDISLTYDSRNEIDVAKTVDSLALVFEDPKEV